MAVINYLNDLVIPDERFDTETPEQIKAWIEDWCRLNWVKEEVVWVCPLMDAHIVFGEEPDWRAFHD